MGRASTQTRLLLESLGKSSWLGTKDGPFVGKGLRNLSTQTPKQEWKRDRSRQPRAYHGCHGVCSGGLSGLETGCCPCIAMGTPPSPLGQYRSFLIQASPKVSPEPCWWTAGKVLASTAQHSTMWVRSKLGHYLLGSPSPGKGPTLPQVPLLS